LKVETDIIAKISASSIGQAGIFVLMSVDVFRIDIIVFIGGVIMCFTIGYDMAFFISHAISTLDPY
jgi:hypothetical protein